MAEHRAKGSYRKGLEALERGDFLDALAYFESTLELSGGEPGRLPVAAMSYYGLCLAMASDRLVEARDICEAAAEAAPTNPEMYLNLSHVCVRQGDRAHAFRTLVRGLRVEPRHPGIIEAMRRLGFRRRPVVSFLPRQHPLNRLLGSLRTVVERRTARPAGERRRSLKAA